jgi:C1A family cysteine protease
MLSSIPMFIEANISARWSRRLFFRMFLLALLSFLPSLSLRGTEPGDSNANLPATADLRPMFQKWGLPLRSQGGRGTCSVFALTGALEYALASRQQTGTVLSVEFLNWASNRATTNSGDGGFFSDLWSGYENYGICPEASLPYSKSYDAKLTPNEATLEQAKKIAEANLQLHWIKPWNAATGLTEEQFLLIKRTLARGWPVCGGFRWPKHEVWQNDILQMAPASDVFDGHSVLLVGFKDDATQPGGGVFLIRNSGGGAQDGALPYEYARTYMNDGAWVQPASEVKP